MKHLCFFITTLLSILVSCTRGRDTDNDVLLSPIRDSLIQYINDVCTIDTLVMSIYSISEGDTIIRFGTRPFSDEAAPTVVDNHIVVIERMGIDAFFLKDDCGFEVPDVSKSVIDQCGLWYKNDCSRIYRYHMNTLELLYSSVENYPYVMSRKQIKMGNTVLRRKK